MPNSNGVRFNKRDLRRWQRRIPRPQGASNLYGSSGRKPALGRVCNEEG